MCNRIEMNPHAATSDEYVQPSVPAEQNVMTAADLPRIITIFVLAIAAAVAGGFAGMQLGEALSYAVARLTDRDIAELKDMLIWSLIAGMATGAAAGVWIVFALARTPRWLQRSALALLTLVALGSTAITVAAYDWPKSSGHPVVHYELRLPKGVVLPPMSELRLEQWQGKSGHGIYIDRTGIVDGRAQISGSFAINRDSKGSDMALGLARNIESRWRIPYTGDAKLEKDFSPWQSIDLQPSPRTGTEPLPAGEYHIRYRVRRYM
jgi:hypothetical protein